MKWKMAAGITGALLLALAGGTAFYLVFFTTPRMKIQAHIRPFEALMPTAPASSVSLEETELLTGERFPLPGEATAQATPELIGQGEVYYGYYCLYCHGEKGDGEGPVGQSYMPRPSDLRTMKVRNMKDEELLRAMLLGTGHEPVINRVVPPAAHVPLLVYIRALPIGEG